MRRVAGALLVIVGLTVGLIVASSNAGATAVDPPPIPPGTVSAAEVGAPPGTAPLAPVLPVAPASVVAAATAGAVLPFGDALPYGSLSGRTINQPVVAMVRTADSKGYWLVAADGGVFTFGDAGFYGSTGSVNLGQPVVAMAATLSGRGYWLVAADGGVFTFGDARFFGSLGGVHLNRPVVGVAPTPSGKGYWLVASDGGVFTFGDAVFHGAATGAALEQPVQGIVATLGGGGYWLVEGLRSPPVQPFASLFSPALVGALNQRAGIVSASVLDLNTGYAYSYRPGQLGITASIVKVEILGTLLAHAQAARRGLTANEQSVATSMIEVSDNGSATQLFNEVGGAPAVAAFDRSVGMTSTTPSGAWGLTVTTAADQVVLLKALVEPNSVLSDGSRAYELGLMEHVTPSQAWGVSAGTVAGTTVALKNGWLPVGSGWTVNSIGWVSGLGRDYLIAVTTSADPGEGYGIASISMVAAAAWGALGH